MASTFNTFVKFGTDAAGLERLLRLLQSLLQITLSYPILQTLLLNVFFILFPTTPFLPSPSATILSSLNPIRTSVATTRRVLRTFRFLDAFAAAHAQYGALRDAPSWDAWLGVGAASFNGFYLLSETVLLLGLDRLSVDGTWGKVLFVEGQRFWFLALGCAVARGVGVAWRAAGDGGLVPADGKTGEKEVGEDEKKKEEEVASRRAKEVRERKMARFRTLRRLVADVLDMAVPGSAIGWVPMGPGPVGVAMLGSTILTAWEVWERCAREAGAA